MTHTISERNKTTRDLSTCMTEKSSSYQMVQTKYKKKLTVKLEPVEITFYLVKHFKMNINCYFSTDESMAYSRGENALCKTEHTNACECHHCSTFLARKPIYDKHGKNCAGIPGIMYRFENQNLVTFVDILKY